MGKQTGIITFKGKVGNVVGARDSKGDLTIKAYQPEVKQTNTEGQIIARVRFLTITALAKGLRKGLFGLSNYAAQQKLTNTNAFQRLNKLAVECYPPDLTANPPRKDYEGHVTFPMVKIATGSLATTIAPLNPLAQRNLEWTSAERLTIDVGFAENDRRPEGEETRLVTLVVYNKNKNATVVSAPAGYALGDVSIENVMGWEAGETIYAWLVVQDFKDTDTMGRYLSYWNNGVTTAEAKASFEALQRGAEYADSKLIGSVVIPEFE